MKQERRQKNEPKSQGLLNLKCLETKKNRHIDDMHNELEMPI